jgi:hypothetical protein
MYKYKKSQYSKKSKNPNNPPINKIQKIQKNPNLSNSPRLGQPPPQLHKFHL